jgi:hypothetical protein
MDEAMVQTAARGVPPERVAAVIERALTSRRMRSRYVVGIDARAMIFALGLLPDRLRDVLMRRALGL